MTSWNPTTLIVRTAGTNCDRELAHAFSLAGCRIITLHLNQLIQDPAPLATVDLIGFPGGFSYGDDIAAGRIFANRMRHRLAPALHAAVQRGVPVIGICNGFQVLTKLGLLPFPDDMLQGRQNATLADNVSGRFIDQWASMQAASDSVCIWTKGLDCFDLPIAHGEGRFLPADDALLARLREQKQIALRYAAAPTATFPGNPNGSIDDIAGICDPSGLVLGLMPHPERHVHYSHHPLWTRQAVTDSALLQRTPPGLRFFQNAVAYVMSKSAAAV